MSKPRVILDANAFLISISKNSNYRPIFDSLLENRIQLLVTNEIISEYTEIIGRKANALVANNIVETLSKLVNVEKIEVSYKWQLIIQDPDDNKFVDCAVAGNSDFLVTNDRHFAILKDIPFPHVNVISIQEFAQEIEKL